MKNSKPKEPEKSTDLWELRLYVAGQTPKSLAAFANLKKICEEHLAGCYRIEVIDLLKNPTLARGDQILAIPTLVRKLPSQCERSSVTSPTQRGCLSVLTFALFLQNRGGKRDKKDP